MARRLSGVEVVERRQRALDESRHALALANQILDYCERRHDYDLGYSVLASQARIRRNIERDERLLASVRQSVEREL